MKRSRKLLAGILAICMLLVMVPWSLPAYAETPEQTETAETPVERIEFEPTEVIYHHDGHWESYYNDATENYEDYFYYYVYPQYTVYFKDGTSCESDSNGYILYDDSWINIDFTQDYYNQLTLGANTIEGSILGYETAFEVTVAESPIERIEFDPLTVVENTNGYAESYYDNETDSYKEYYYYNLVPAFTVYFRDGTSEYVTHSSGIYYKDNWYSYNYIINEDHQLTLGENAVPFTLLGFETTFNVNIVECPIERIEFETLRKLENAGGYWTSEYDYELEEWVDYYVYNNLYPNFTVYLKDGSTLSNRPGDSFITYQGVDYYLVFESQNYSNKLSMGTNTLQCWLMNYENTFNVEVIKTPVERIEITHPELIQNYGGYYEYYYDNDTGERKSYYHYNLTPELTIYLDDGTVLTPNEFGEVQYQGDWFETTIGQSFEHQLTVGTNTVSLNIMNFDTTFEVTVIDTPIDRIEFEPMEIIQNTNGYMRDAYDEETDTDYEYYHYNLYPSFTVYFKDGSSVTERESGSFWYNDQWHYLNILQDGAHQLKPGTNAVSCSVLSYETTFEVNIAETPIERIDFEPLTVIENVGGHNSSYYDEETSDWQNYFHYELFPTFTVYFKDGTSYSREESSGIEYNGTHYSLYNDQGGGNILTPGSNTLNYSVLGFEASMEVTVIECPVERIEFEPLELLEHTNGSWNNYYDDESGSYKDYYYYYFTPQFTVYLKDGSSLTSNEDGFVTYCNRDYYLDYNQNGEHQLTLGTNTVSASIMGFETAFEVAVIDTPIDRIEFEPMALVQNTNGYWTDYYDDETDNWQEYYYYDLNPQYTVYLKDGTVLTPDEYGNVEYKEEWYGLATTQNGKNQLTSGTNTVSASIMGFETSFEVEIIDTFIDRIEFEPLEFIQYTNGYWNEYYDDATDSYKEYFHYELYPDFTVYLKDGTVISDDGSGFYYENQWYSLYRVQDAEHQLTLGTNNVSATIMNFETSFTVNIIESPIERIEFEPLEIIENARGEWIEYYDEETDSYKEYFCYDLYPRFTVYMKDGTVLPADDNGEINYNGSWYYLYKPQNIENRLTLGSNTVAASMMGFNTSFEVTVVECPIDRIEFEPLELIENINGYWDFDYESGSYQEYFRYYLEPRFTVYLKDGTTLPDNGTGVYYNNIWYPLACRQNSLNCLKMGENTVSANLMGMETSFNATVIETPIEQVEFELIEIIQNTNGFYEEYYDHETESYKEYFHYDLSPRYTVFLKNGSTLTSNYNGQICYNNTYYDLSYTQNHEHQLTLGANTVDTFIMGFNTSFEVNIIECPVERIEFEPIEIIQNTNGELDSYYDEETNSYIEYYRYYLNPTFTIYLKDGSSLTNEDGSGIDYNDQWYGLDYDSMPMVLGSNTVSASIMGFDAPFEVNIIESPVERIEIESVELIENANGSWHEYYDEETDSYKEYFYYYLSPEYTVYLKDGSTLTSDIDGYVYYNGIGYYLNHIQNDKHQLTLGSNTVSASILGFETSFEVEIIKTPIERIEFEPIEIIRNTNGYFDEYYDSETDSYKEYFFYWLHPQYTVYLTDGTTLTSDHAGEILYNDRWYSLWFDQGSENQLTLGTNTVSASLLSFETSFEVNVVESPVERVEIEPLEIYENSNGHWETAYNEFDEEVSYFHYYLEPEFTVYFKDGTTATPDRDGDILYQGTYYALYTEQNYENHLTFGVNILEASILGFDTTMEVRIVESPYASFEILEVQPLHQNDYYGWDWDEDGNRVYYYDVPNFSYKVTMKDGTVIYGDTYEDWDENLSVSSEQYRKPWTVGGINEFTAYYTNLTATANVTMLEPIYFDYTVQEGGAYIWGCSIEEPTVTIPEEIDGYPVLGVLYLDGANSTLEHLIIPDSVVHINEQGLGYLPYLKTITIGSNVTYLTCEMLESHPRLEAVYISEENPAFVAVDGIVYNKNMDTLVFYPLPEDTEPHDYHVPASVTNIDAISGAKYAIVNVIFDENSTAYKTIDGVTYSADMTRILSCDPAKSGKFVMPESVTSIAANAFEGCTALTEVIVSPNVTEITYCAFLNCSALSAIEMPQSVISIGDNAFSNCAALTEVELPQKLQVIGNSAFTGTALTALTIPDSVLGIMNSAFAKTDIATLKLGNSLEFIGDKAFSGIDIETLTLPDSFVESGEAIFSNCENLKEIHFGSQLCGVSYRSFEGCTALKSVTFPENIMYIHEDAFMNCTALEKADFMNDEVYIGEYAFYNCALKTLKLGNKVEAISAHSFAGNNLTTLTLPDSVTYIAYSAFKNCTDLAKIDIPETLVDIDDEVFNNTAWYEAQGNGAVYLEHILYDYKNFVYDQNILEVKPGTTGIAGGALDSQCKLEHVTLPDGLKSIGSEAFFLCSNLQEIFIPEGVTAIWYGTFEGCENLTDIVLPSTLEYISYNAFDSHNMEHILFMGSEQQWDDVYVESGSFNTNKIHFGTPKVLRVQKATCTTPGYTVYGCPECDAEHIRYTEPTGHIPAGKTEIVAPTCSTFGSESGVCKICKSEYTNKLYKTDHTFADGNCSACGLVEIRTEHPYGDDSDQTWTYTEAGATQISVTFHPMTRLSNWDDAITIYDADDNVIGIFRNAELANETIVIPGDTVKIEFKASHRSNYGFEVTDIVAQKVLSSNDVKLSTKPATLDPEVELVAEITEVAPEIQRPAGLEESQTFAYDITLEKGGEEVQPDGDVEITLPVPDTMDGSSCQVYHLADDGTWTNMNASYKNGELTFTTDHFSQYVIMEAFDTASVVRIMQHLIGMEVDINVAAIDRNNDEVLTLADAVLLLRSLL